ncbi:MAG: regulatory iron-sulfur-containing complex subunit RicT, partial [Kofleriaceae bacterium]
AREHGAPALPLPVPVLRGEGGGEDSGAEAGGPAVDGAPAADGAPRKKRRRRRRGRGERADAPAGAPSGGAPEATQRLEGDPYAPGAEPAPAPRPPQPQPQPPRQQQQQRPQRPPQPQPPQRERGRREGRGRERSDHRNERRREEGPAVDLREDDVAAQNDLRTRAENAAGPTGVGSSVGGALKHAHRPKPEDDEDDVAAPTGEAWGTDDGSPAPAIALKSELPADPLGDLDPTTAHLLDEPAATRGGEDVVGVVGVRFVPAGRVTWFDAGDADYTPGERVLVDADRGGRLGWIATVPVRRALRDRGIRRVIRRANEQDLRGETATDDNRVRALRTAKDKAAALRLPLKVFRVELGAGKLLVYYTSDDRLDLRDFVRDIAQATGLRPELRQLGVRDEAKAVGGIGSCGLTLCCTTWLPDFVPVSIKMAKDQGLVLSPTKVSGQCGRLKCCLVYEQAAYAELRKGLPKLGKRVTGARGEGRIVEVDVLRQRVRVSYGAGDTEVVPAAEVTPLFPAGNPPPGAGAPRGDRPPRPDRNDRSDRGRDTHRSPQAAAPAPTPPADDDDDLPPDPSRDPELDALDDDFPSDPSRDPDADD